MTKYEKYIWSPSRPSPKENMVQDHWNKNQNINTSRTWNFFWEGQHGLQEHEKHNQKFELVETAP